MDDRLNNLFLELKEEIVVSPPESNPTSLAEDDRITTPVPEAIYNPNNGFVACPMLKAEWDDTIRYEYPKKENMCFRSKKSKQISLDQQTSVCLTKDFRKCPFYLQIDLKEKPPKEIRGISLTGIKIIGLNSLSVYLIILFLVIAFVVLFVMVI
ncbi:MAG: hypothetical protein P4L50_12580 [Anaerolineaceae bacterium]|nr:hypothetical protein [Anaerolineaceae bacterium]